MSDLKRLAIPLAIGASALTLGGLGIYALSRRNKYVLPYEPLPLPTMAPPPGSPPPTLVIPQQLGEGGITIDGVTYRVPVPVNTSLRFNIGDPGTTARHHAVNLGVIHWSGGEPSDGSGVYQTLEQRGLSCHFIIDRSGTIWQCADPATTVCAHAGSAYNGRSWGVEVVDFGILEEGESVPRAARGRDLYRAVVQGEEYEMADFLPAQYTALFALADLCADRFNIPRVVRGAPWERTSGIVEFAGHVGHMHISPWKPDPGPRPLERMGARPGWRMS